MRMRSGKDKGKGNGHHNGRGGNGRGSRSEKNVTNQLAFNVICLAVAVGGDSHTEPCQSAYND